jgi:hypothetical protein
LPPPGVEKAPPLLPHARSAWCRFDIVGIKDQGTREKVPCARQESRRHSLGVRAGRPFCAPRFGFDEFGIQRIRQSRTISSCIREWLAEPSDQANLQSREKMPCRER